MDQHTLIQPLLHIRPISPPAETLAMLRPRPSAPGTSSPVSSSSGATTTAMDNPRARLLERKHHDPPSPPSYNTIDGSSSSPESPIPPAEDGEMDLSNMSRKSQWIILAIASGACAAFNGVFAKLYVKAYCFFLRHVCNLQQIVTNCSSQLLPHCFLRSLMRHSHSRIFRVLSLLTSLRQIRSGHIAGHCRLTWDMQDNDRAHNKLRGFNCSALGPGERGEGCGGCY
jgi:hypothetical protein